MDQFYPSGAPSEEWLRSQPAPYIPQTSNAPVAPPSIADQLSMVDQMNYRRNLVTPLARQVEDMYGGALDQAHAGDIAKALMARKPFGPGR